ncbi:M4 family metallopeptidase [Janibacter sp. GXQ6167]|uniref:M4 family metallopeptidase n=1 Tax=Janibacter sp. GXQ6167 TaxID=3240791 RepID=UPI0035239C15
MTTPGRRTTIFAVTLGLTAASIAPALAAPTPTAESSPIASTAPVEDPAPGDPPVADTDTPAHTDVTVAAPSGSAATAATTFLAKREQTYGIDTDEVSVDQVDVQGQDAAVRLQQEVDGVPVLGATYVVRLSGKGSKRVVTGTSGRYFTQLDVDTAKGVPSGPARQVAQKVTGQRYRFAAAPSVEDKGLVVLPFDQGVLTRHLTVTGFDTATSTPVREQVYLAAGLGRPVLRYNDLPTFAPTAPSDDQVTTTGKTFNQPDKPLHVTRAGSRYSLLDRSTPMYASSGGTIATFDAKRRDAGYFLQPPRGAAGMTPVSSTTVPFTSASNRYGALDAHWGAREVYDYYRGLGRNSLDDKGGSIESIVGLTMEGNDYANAFWNGKAMFYGTGGSGYKPFSASLDVVAHEMTHGVTEHSSNLVYFGQSGAINEAVSDYFGNAVQNKVLGISETSNRASLMGEDLCISKSMTSCAIRDLRKVVKTSQYLGGFEDNGGVHTNSLIPGGAMWQVRRDLGADLADRVFYRVQTQYLTPLAGLTDLRVATISAAQDLGATSEQRAAIGRAFDSRGITAGWERSVAKVDSVALKRNTGAAVDRPGVHGSVWVMSMTASNLSGPAMIRMGSTSKPGSSRVITKDKNSSYTLPSISRTRVGWIRMSLSGGRLRTRVEIAPRNRLDRPTVIADTRDMVTNLSVGSSTVAWTRATSSSSSIYVRRPGGKTIKIAPGRGRVLSDTTVIEDQVVYTDSPGWGSSRVANVLAYNARTGKTKKLTSVTGSAGYGVGLGQPAVAGKWVVFPADRVDDRWGAAGIWRVPLAGGTARQVLSETHRWAPIGAPVTASTTHVTFANDKTSYPESRLYQVPMGGGSIRRMSCSTGTQGLAVAASRQRVVWVDYSVGGPDLVTRETSRARC